MSQAYFERLERALKEAGCFRPVLVIDRDRLDENIALMRERPSPGLALRIVDKSLPSLPLIRHVMEAVGSRRIMSFHLPITQRVLEESPEADVLYGKPMPVEAAAQAFERADNAMRHALCERVVWLIDSRERLDAYVALADRLGLRLRIAFEVDVGMHRGGLATPAELVPCLQRARSSGTLKIDGIMGYEAHIPQVPRFAGGPDAERARVIARFDAFVACLAADERTILNTAGSKTTLTYGASSHANDVSAGSAFLLPSDFDTPGLAGFQPAAFIATPVLKVVETLMPGPPAFRPLSAGWGLSRSGTAIFMVALGWRSRFIPPAFPKAVSGGGPRISNSSR
jgi:D-serine deaminase-like pyridoxal phosphate-dependent protein